MGEGKKIIGFRRVRGRVIPISGHVAGNAGAASIGLAGSAYIMKRQGSKLLKFARTEHSSMVKRKVKLMKHAQFIDDAHRLKDISSGDFMFARGTVQAQRVGNAVNMAEARGLASKATKQLRHAKLAGKAAVAMGALAGAALLYQGLSRKKK